MDMVIRQCRKLSESPLLVSSKIRYISNNISDSISNYKALNNKLLIFSQNSKLYIIIRFIAFQPQYELKKGSGHSPFFFVKVIDKIAKLSGRSNQFPEKDIIYKNEGQQFEAISTFKILNVNELRDLSRGELKPTLINKQKVTFGETPNKLVR